jgi:hypothetical protein
MDGSLPPVDALLRLGSNLDGCLYPVERGRYVSNEAEYTRWIVDDLDEAVRGLHELLAVQSP